MKTVWLITALIAICLILASPFASAKIYLLEHEDYEQYNLGSSPTLTRWIFQNTTHYISMHNASSKCLKFHNTNASVEDGTAAHLFGVPMLRNTPYNVTITFWYFSNSTTSRESIWIGHNRVYNGIDDHSIVLVFYAVFNHYSNLFIISNGSNSITYSMADQTWYGVYIALNFTSQKFYTAFNASKIPDRPTNWGTFFSDAYNAIGEQSTGAMHIVPLVGKTHDVAIDDLTVIVNYFGPKETDIYTQMAGIITITLAAGTAAIIIFIIRGAFRQRSG